MTLAQASARRAALRLALIRLQHVLDHLPTSRTLRELETSVIALRADVEREARAERVFVAARERAVAEGRAELS